MTKDNHAPTYAANRFSIAPMLDWTDRHCRYFHRLLTKETLLYTEMVTTGAIIHGKGDYGLQRRSIRWRCSWAAAIRPRWRTAPNWRSSAVTTRLTSTSAARPIACKTACSVPV